MPYTPQTQDEVYQDLLGLITNQSDRMTNFSPRTPNYVLTHDGYAGQFSDYETALLAVQLSGWVDFAGGPVSREDLQDLNIDPDGVDLTFLNSMMDDGDLDDLGLQSSVERDPGEEATGEVLITTTTKGATIDSEIEFGTTPDDEGNYLSYFTIEQVQAAENSTTVTAPIRAEEVGNQYNVGANRIEHIPGAAPGVDSVTNPESTSGGENPETNDEYRIRIRESTSRQSGGGTKNGIRGYIMENTDGIQGGDIFVDEVFPQDPESTESYTYVDVVVDHTDSQHSTLIDLVDQSKPVGIEHNVLYPTYIDLDITATVISDDADAIQIEDRATNYISELAIGEELYRDRVIQRIMNTDEDIRHIDPLDIITKDEPHVYDSTQSQYNLNSLAVDDGIIEITGTKASDGTQGTFATSEYSLLYDSNDHLYGIDWSTGTETPQDGSEFYIDYNILRDAEVKERQKFTPSTVDITVQS